MNLSNITNDIFDKVWVKKYAPKNINEMVLSEENRIKVNEFIENGEFPTLLFCGAPGQGKTTLAVNLCKAINAMTLEINASFDNGIDIIRGKVNNFVETMSPDGSLKVVILDEADRLSIQSQDALRGMIESCAEHTRFILTANELARITPALQSRCISLSVVPPYDGFKKYICNIIYSENIQVKKDELPKLSILLKKNYPDLRKTIGLIQKSCIGGVLQINENEISDNFIEEIYNNFNLKNPIEIRETWIKNENKFQGDYQCLLKQLHSFVYNKNDISPVERANIILEIAVGLFESTSVVDQEINFYKVILKIMKLLGKF